jgi:3-ketoacyl-CoA synthase
MGCSAGAISIDLAHDLLQVHPNSNVLVFSTENITQNWYLGNQKNMVLSNTLFRCGGAAILLTNKSSGRLSAKYELEHVVRVHLGADDTAFQAVYQVEDDAGIVGVRLSKELIKVVGEALRKNLTILGPLVLPYSEQLKFISNRMMQNVDKWRGIKPRKAYTPIFRKAFNHFCIHAGGRAVIDGLEQNLNLTKAQCAPSRATLWRYGNTSSSSIWYELSYIESQVGIKKNEKIWQIAFGSGFKCNSVVWKALRSVKDEDRGDWDLTGADFQVA